MLAHGDSSLWPYSSSHDVRPLAVTLPDGARTFLYTENLRTATVWPTSPRHCTAVTLGGPGITRSDLLIINKTDLAPHVGDSLEVMARDAKKQRGERPFVFTNLKAGDGVDEIVKFIRARGLLDEIRKACA